MKKLFSVLGVFVLIFGLSSFTVAEKDKDNLKSSRARVGNWASDGFCDPGGVDCAYVQLPTIVIVIKK